MDSPPLGPPLDSLLLHVAGLLVNTVPGGYDLARPIPADSKPELAVVPAQVHAARILPSVAIVPPGISVPPFVDYGARRYQRHYRMNIHIQIHYSAWKKAGVQDAGPQFGFVEHSGPA